MNEVKIICSRNTTGAQKFSRGYYGINNGPAIFKHEDGYKIHAVAQIYRFDALIKTYHSREKNPELLKQICIFLSKNLSTTSWGAQQDRVLKITTPHGQIQWKFLKYHPGYNREDGFEKYLADNASSILSAVRAVKPISASFVTAYDLPQEVMGKVKNFTLETMGNKLHVDLEKNIKTLAQIIDSTVGEESTQIETAIKAAYWAGLAAGEARAIERIESHTRSVLDSTRFSNIRAKIYSAFKKLQAAKNEAAEIMAWEFDI
jgi:hypothetical protein